MNTASLQRPKDFRIASHRNIQVKWKDGLLKFIIAYFLLFGVQLSPTSQPHINTNGVLTWQGHSQLQVEISDDVYVKNIVQELSIKALGCKTSSVR